MDLPRYLRLHQRRKWMTAIAVIVIGIVLYLADHQGWLVSTTAERQRYDGHSFRVARVIDGDTIDIEAVDGDFPVTRVRLWGIDTPELARPREGKPADPFAQEAHALARELAQGKWITVKLDPHQTRDRYNRLLAYIILPDGSVLNEVLLLEGLALFVDLFPHQHLERFQLLEKQAKFERKGLWKR